MPINKSMGNITPAKKPILRLLPKAPETIPTTVGPPAHPTSPANASNANIAVPPLASEAAALLNTPGHMIPTDRPHNAQPIKPTMGLGTSEMQRYAIIHKMLLTIIN